MYKILGADQKEYGPVSAEVVRQWIAERRASAQTRVRAEGTTEWKPLSEVQEFRDALATPPSLPSVQAASTPLEAGPAPQPVRTGLAVGSLILGILSMVCFGLLTGIPAIVLGHVAYNRARKSPRLYGGSGLAIAGFVMGYASLFTTAILAAMLLPALAKGKDRVQSISCTSNLKQIGLAARMYANDHEQTFPKDFPSMSNELINPKLLVCPGDSTKTRAVDWSTLTPQNISYEIVSPAMKEGAATTTKVFVRCPIHGHVCRGDGTVQSGDPTRRR
jgi:hypothetical protein